MKLSFEQKNSSNPKSPNAGTYLSTVTYIGYCDDYDDESAIEVLYSLVDDAGNKFNYREIFYNDVKIPRTYNFFNYLILNGVNLDEVESFIGCQEKVIIKKKRTSRGIFKTISEREFLGRSEVSTNEMANEKW